MIIDSEKLNKQNEQDPCTACGFYANRAVGIDAVIIKDDSVLLVKRLREPFKGYWATPGGYVNWGETTEETVIREVKEETNLDVTSSHLIKVYSSIDRHPKQAISLGYAVVADGNLKKGDDAQECRFFPLNKLPENLAMDHRNIINDYMNISRF